MISNLEQKLLDKLNFKKLTGKELSQFLKVNPVRVRLMIMNLRKKGYTIEANNKGYIWSNTVDMRAYALKRKQEILKELENLKEWL